MSRRHLFIPEELYTQHSCSITVYLEEEEEEKVCWLFTSIDVHNFTSSGAMTLRPSLHSCHKISKSVLTIPSKRPLQFLSQSESMDLLELGWNLILCGMYVLIHTTGQTFNGSVLQGEIFQRMSVRTESYQIRNIKLFFLS